MAQIVNGPSGPSNSAHSEKYKIAGKAATAQYWRKGEKGTERDNRGWFVAFAPYDKPALAITLLVEGVESANRTCGPIAKQMIEQCLALPVDGSGTVDPVEAPLPAATPKEASDHPLGPEDAKLWSIMRELGDVAELPADTRDLQIRWVGHGIPRTLELSLFASGDVAKAWLMASVKDRNTRAYPAVATRLTKPSPVARAQPEPVIPRNDSTVTRSDQKLDGLKAAAAKFQLLNRLLLSNGKTFYASPRSLSGPLASFVENPQVAKKEAPPWPELGQTEFYKFQGERGGSCEVVILAIDKETVEVRMTGLLKRVTVF